MNKPGKLQPFFLSAHPLQGLAESYILGLLILFVTSRVEEVSNPDVAAMALLFLCFSCGLWAVYRIRLIKGSWHGKVIGEFMVALCLGAIMVFALKLSAHFFKWDNIWQFLEWETEDGYALLGLTGTGYFIARLFLRAWFRWENMRKKRMLWAITHSQISVISFIAFILSLIVFFLIFNAETEITGWIKSNDPVSSVFAFILLTIFPAFSFITLILTTTLIFILPPSTVFSFFLSRKITRRLESLASTTASLRSGDYSARVAVEGEDEIALLQSDFNVMAAKLSSTLHDLEEEKETVAQVLQSRRDLIANVSHELRTPVATLRAAIETMLGRWETTPEPEKRGKIELMGNEILRLSGLIDDLFTLAQADVDRLSLECVPTNITPVVQQVVDMFSPYAWQTGRVEVAAQIPDGLPEIMVDPRRLQQILLNLLRNGVRHTPPGGIVAVSASSDDTSLVIEVRDTGEGIPPEDLPRVFERFFRGPNAAPDSAGLGLSLVKEMVESMDGTVRVESEPGQGTCFLLVFPTTTEF